MRLQVLLFLLLVSCLNSASGYEYTTIAQPAVTSQIEKSNEKELTQFEKIEKLEKQQQEILQQQSLIMSQIDLISTRVEKTEESENGN